MGVPAGMPTSDIFTLAMMFVAVALGALVPHKWIWAVWIPGVILVALYWRMVGSPSSSRWMLLSVPFALIAPLLPKFLRRSVDRIRGKRRYIGGPRQISGSRLALSSVGMSYPITIDGCHYSVTTMNVRNIENRFPNSCEVRGKLHFKHMHLGHEFTIDAWFRFEREPPFDVHKAITLNDGEMNARAILFVTGNGAIGDQALYTYIQRKFDPRNQETFPTGEWEITLKVFGENESDKAYAKIHVNVGRKNGLSMGILE